LLSAQTEFLISLFLLLACAIVAGELALRLGQLALVGQLLVGIALGPTLVGPYIGLSTVSPELSAVQILATFFLLFLAGLEMGPSQFYTMKWTTLVLGLSIFFIPFGIIFVVLHFVAPQLGFLVGAFVAVTLSITALPVMAVMVKELGLVDREFGRVVMAAALVNELAAVTVFAVLLQLYDAGGAVSFVSVGLALGATALFLGVVFAAYFALKYAREHSRISAASNRFGKTVRSQEAGFALLMILSLGAALFSQYLGLTFVIGAFYAGILVTPDSVGKPLYDGLRKVLHVFMWGLFIPVFFAITGLQTDLRLLFTPAAGIAFIALLLAAAFTKVGTGMSITRMLKWSEPDSVAFGFLVNSRGAVEIAMAVILFTTGILTTFWFTVVVAVGLVCTILAPMGAVWAWKWTPESRADLYARAPSLSVRGVFLASAEESVEPNGPAA
jgi:Kef-type K+ transport system membrane component KefB